MRVYFDILDNSLIPIIENWFGDDEVIYQYDNTSYHWAKGIKASGKAYKITSKQFKSKPNWKNYGENLKRKGSIRRLHQP